MNKNEEIKSEIRNILEEINVALTINTGIYETEKERFDFINACINDLYNMIEKIQ